MPGHVSLYKQRSDLKFQLLLLRTTLNNLERNTFYFR